jgi:uncharacterized coiled-coil protein SlyX
MKERKEHDKLSEDENRSPKTGLEAISNKTFLILDVLGIDAEQEVLLDEINELLAKGENLSEQKDKRRIEKMQHKLETIRNKLISSVSKSRNSKRKATILKVLYDFELIKENSQIDRKKQRFLLNLREADFRCANLAGIYLAHVNLQGVNLQGANLERAYLFYANLESPSNITTKLQGASLEHAYLQSIDPNSDYITTLECADLRGANLESANLDNVNLRGINLKYAELDGAILKNADFTRGGYAHRSVSDLRYATGLVKEQLEKAKLCKTFLPTNLEGSLDSSKDC